MPTTQPARATRSGSGQAHAFCRHHAFRPRFVNTPVRNTEKLHVTERFPVDPGKMALNRSYTAEDPVYLKGKYTGSDIVFPVDAPFDPGKRRELDFIDYLKQQKQ